MVYYSGVASTINTMIIMINLMINFIFVSLFIKFMACFLTCIIILQTIRLRANGFKRHAKTQPHVLLYHKIIFFSLNPIRIRY